MFNDAEKEVMKKAKEAALQFQYEFGYKYSGHDDFCAGYQAAAERYFLFYKSSSHFRSNTVTRTAPPRIWLQVSNEKDDAHKPFPGVDPYLTWCADSVSACEVEYVRADLWNLRGQDSTI